MLLENSSGNANQLGQKDHYDDPLQDHHVPDHIYTSAQPYENKDSHKSGYIVRQSGQAV